MTSSQATDCLSCSSLLSEYIFCDNTPLISHLQGRIFSCCFITLSEMFSPAFLSSAQAWCQPCQPHKQYLINLSVSSRLSTLTSEFRVLNCTISHSPQVKDKSLNPLVEDEDGRSLFKLRKICIFFSYSDQFDL